MQFGAFKFLVVPMGLTNSPATFQYFMNDIFQDMANVFVIVYLDYILIFSKDIKEHRHHVQKVLSVMIWLLITLELHS